MTRPASSAVHFAAVVAQKLRVLGLRGAVARAHAILRRSGGGGIRDRLRHWAAAGTAPYVEAGVPPSLDKRFSDGPVPGVNLVGHPYGALGMGEHIRKSAQAFAAAGVDFAIVNTFGQTGPHAAKFPEFPHHDRIGRVHPHPVSVFHMNADEMPLASAHLGPGFFAGRYNIGYWAWELADFPEAWRSAFAYFDEIWAPSRFIQQAVARKARCPVIHMPLAVEFPPQAPLPRHALGLPEHRFVFLFYFDFTSYVTRKNPHAVVDAFDRAFPPGHRDRVALAIKLNGSEQKPDDYRRFLASLGGRRDAIVLIDRVMSDYEVRSLVQNCDAFVSLHRSEGFGRGLAEAMYFGKPTIGTAYSGNLDYMNADNACLVDATLVPVGAGQYPHGDGQVWAEPDVDQAAMHMRRLASDPGLGRALGERARCYMRREHGFDAVGARYRSRLLRVREAVLGRHTVAA